MTSSSLPLFFPAIRLDNGWYGDAPRLTTTNDYEARLSKGLRFMVRGTGIPETRSNDFLSMIMFQHDEVERMIELAEHDTRARTPGILALLCGAVQGAGALIDQIRSFVECEHGRLGCSFCEPR